MGPGPEGQRSTHLRQHLVVPRVVMIAPALVVVVERPVNVATRRRRSQVGTEQLLGGGPHSVMPRRVVAVQEGGKGRQLVIVGANVPAACHHGR